VRFEEWEYDPPVSRHFAEIYVASLNTHVKISFVPDVSEACPPWGEGALSDEPEVASEREARITQVLTSYYSVTPNAGLAGRTEAVRLLPGQMPPELGQSEPTSGDRQYGVVWYLDPADWSALAEELAGLAAEAWNDLHALRYSQIGRTRLARFLEERFLPSGRVSQDDLQLLHRG
jgi:hypothetical protein